MILLLAFAMTVCGQIKSDENRAERETQTDSDDENREMSDRKDAAGKAEFDFESKTVMLNSGYEMPINGLGTYSLHGEECINSVKAALSNGVRLIDTASAYGNEEKVGQAVQEAIDEGIIRREDVFVITKIYPGDEMENPEQSIQTCIDRLDIGYVDMMLLHHPDANDVKAYKAIERYVRDGKIHSVGLSNWYVEELEEFLPQVDMIPALVQNEIHPYYQENDVIPFIQELGIVVRRGGIPWGEEGIRESCLADGEGMDTMKNLGRNMAYLLKALERRDG